MPRKKEIDPASLAGKEILSIDEAAAWLGLSYNSVRKLILDGVIPAIKLGGQWRVHKPSVADIFKRAALKRLHFPKRRSPKEWSIP